MENARKITLFFENKQIRAGTLGNIHVHELIRQNRFIKKTLVCSKNVQGCSKNQVEFLRQGKTNQPKFSEHP